MERILEQRAVKSKKRIKFKGWDWTELLQLESMATKWPKLKLADLVETPPGCTDEDHLQMETINQYLGSIMWDDGNKAIKRERERACKYVRRFLEALASHKHDTARYIYAGMAKTKSDFTLIQWVTNNLGMLWN
jgi:hypothetical protein